MFCRLLFLLLLTVALFPVLPTTPAATQEDNPVYIFADINEYQGETGVTPGTSNFTPEFHEKLRDMLLAQGVTPVFLSYASGGTYPEFFADPADYEDAPGFWERSVSVSVVAYQNNDLVNLSPFSMYEFDPLPVGTSGLMMSVMISPDRENSMDAVVALSTGMALYTIRECDKAIPYFEAATQNTDLIENAMAAYEGANFYRANCEYVLGNPQQAIEAYTAALEFEGEMDLDPSMDPRIFDDLTAINLAWVYIQIGENARALELLNTFYDVDYLSYSSRETNRFLERAELYLALDEGEAAIREITRLIDIVVEANGTDLTQIDAKAYFATDELARLYAERGWRYGKLGMGEEALADYDKAIQTDPTYPKAYYWRGLLYYEREDYERASVDFAQFLELAPDYYNLYEEDLTPYIEAATNLIEDIG
jgi:tetratricopeptide (TPR) repeat protein